MRTPVPPAAAPVKVNGRPLALKFTDEMKRVFLAAVRQGFHIPHAAGIAKVSYQTVWRHRKEDPDFDEAVKEAEAMFALSTMTKMDTLGKENLDHWRWRLEKRFPMEFGKQTAYVAQQNVQNNVLLAPLPSLDEIIERITAARTKSLVEQIEREESEDGIIDITPLPTPDEHVEALIERRADGPLPD